MKYKTIARLEMMKTGAVTDSSGKAYTWTRENFAAFESAYKYENDTQASPVVLGHPKDNGPRLGYISKVWNEPGESGLPDTLCCSAEVAEELYEAMKDGLYPNRSIAVGTKEPKIYHLGILGAVLPAFSNLAPVAFSSPAGDDVFSFQYSEGTQLAVPAESEDGDKIEIEPQEEEIKTGIPIQKEESTMTKEEEEALRAELVDQKSQNAVHATKIAEFSQQIAAHTAKQIETDAATFADALIGEKRIIPAQKELVVAHYCSEAKSAANLTAEFSIGGTKADENPLLKLQAKYKSLPVMAGISGSVFSQHVESSPLSEAQKVVAIQEYVAKHGVSVVAADLALFGNA